MDNMAIYEAVRQAPKNALREIQAGRLKGKSDINPMWRIKALTEQFGPCGIGWKYEIIKEWLEPGANGEIAAFVDINLFIKVDGEWSAAIPGTGGSMYVVKENKGLYTDDEAFKKALTDAISVSCKALGFAADVYWNADSTKYSQRATQAPAKGSYSNEPKKPTESRPAPAESNVVHICANCGERVTAIQGKSGEMIPAERLAAISMKNYGAVLCAECQAKRKAGQHE
jgi:hypothetical protein